MGGRGQGVGIIGGLALLQKEERRGGREEEGEEESSDLCEKKGRITKDVANPGVQREREEVRRGEWKSFLGGIFQGFLGMKVEPP